MNFDHSLQRIRGIREIWENASRSRGCHLIGYNFGDRQVIHVCFGLTHRQHVLRTGIRHKVKRFSQPREKRFRRKLFSRTFDKFYVDLRAWRNLDKEDEKYLIQIMPPGDLIPEVVRSIVLAQNISNAAILFDDSFGR